MSDLKDTSDKAIEPVTGVNVFSSTGEVIEGLPTNVVEPIIEAAKKAMGDYQPPEWMDNPPTKEEELTTRVLMNLASALSPLHENDAGRILAFESFDERRLDVRMFAGDDTMAQVGLQHTFTLRGGVVDVSRKQEVYDDEGIPLADKFKNEHILSEPLADDGTVTSATFVKVLNEIAHSIGMHPSELGEALQERAELKKSLGNISSNFAAAAQVLGPNLKLPGSSNEAGKNQDFSSSDYE